MASIQQAGEAMAASRGARAASDEDEDRVTPLELFFDLVFVFAITQVTALLADRATWTGVGEALLLLALVWRSWAMYAWLTNTLRIDQDRVRLALFAAMTAMFVVALSLPAAFGEHAVLFAAAYAALSATHVLLLAFANDTRCVMAVRNIAPNAVTSCVLVTAGAVAGGRTQAALLLLALVIDYAGAGSRGIAGRTLHPGYFAERHGLMIIIALGESIVATGVGAEATDLGTAEITAAALAIALAATMWWAYFDVVALVAEHRLRDATPGRQQNTLARDAYSHRNALAPSSG